MRVKRKREEEEGGRGVGDVSGRRDVESSVFILVQVSLFVEVFVLRRRKTLLKKQEETVCVQ